MVKIQRDILDKKALETSGEYKKNSKVTFDGKQHTIKIPTKVSSLLKIEKGDVIEFSFKIPEKGFAKKSDLIIKVMNK